MTDTETTLAQWKADIELLSELLRDATDAHDRVQATKRTLAQEEAAIRLSPDIDGKNAEVREAQFARLRDNSRPWRAACEQHENATAELALTQADIECTRERLRLAHATARFELAQYVAAIDSRISPGLTAAAFELGS